MFLKWLVKRAALWLTPYAIPVYLAAQGSYAHAWASAAGIQFVQTVYWGNRVRRIFELASQASQETGRLLTEYVDKSTALEAELVALRSSKLSGTPEGQAWLAAWKASYLARAAVLDAAKELRELQDGKVVTLGKQKARYRELQHEAARLNDEALAVTGKLLDACDAFGPVVEKERLGEPT